MKNEALESDDSNFIFIPMSDVVTGTHAEHPCDSPEVACHLYGTNIHMHTDPRLALELSIAALHTRIGSLVETWHAVMSNLPAPSVPDHVVAYVVTRSAGALRFIGELTEEVREAAERGDRVTLNRAAARIALTAADGLSTIDAFAAARLTRLKERDRWLYDISKSFESLFEKLSASAAFTLLANQACASVPARSAEESVVNVH